MLFFLSILVVAVCMGLGWIELSNSPDKVTIDIETRQMKEAAHEGLQHGKEYLEQTDP